MLSYRHAFHAGNHADVLKHTLLVLLSRYLGEKDKPYWIVDTHAGAGMYDLAGGYADKLREYGGGIGRLWARNDLPPALAAYVDLVRAANPDGILRYYPGSPWFALHTLRPADRLRLFELHPADSALLKANFSGAGRQVSVTVGDGFTALKSQLPPPPRRGLVLIDPPYETRDDYSKVVAALKDGLARFATGTYAVWYPRLARTEAQQLPARLAPLCGKWLHATLDVRHPADDGYGMHGSGVFVLNPPWTLKATLDTLLPYLAAALAENHGAGWSLTQAGA